MLRYFFFLLMINFISVAYAEALVDANALKKIEGVENWPVVDVRELSERSQSPIPGALDFDPELNVEGKVLVVASDNATGLLVARAIESRLRTAEVFIVDGGLKTLRTILTELRPSTDEFVLPGTFTIPSDTCEPGKPLHIFSDEEEK